MGPVCGLGGSLENKLEVSESSSATRWMMEEKTLIFAVKEDRKFCKTEEKGS